jgi:hypothetical protein
MTERLVTRDGMEAKLLRLVLLLRAQQRCRSCGHREAAGAYCSRCVTPILPARDWFDGGTRPLPPASRAELEAIVEDFDHGGLEEF